MLDRLLVRFVLVACKPKVWYSAAHANVAGSYTIDYQSQTLNLRQLNYLNRIEDSIDLLNMVYT